MHATTVTVQPFGSERAFTITIAEVHAQFQAVPDQRKRQGVRYPLAVLLTIALLAKLSGYSQLRALAERAPERAVELAALFGLECTSMHHPTTWDDPHRTLTHYGRVSALAPLGRSCQSKK